MKSARRDWLLLGVFWVLFAVAGEAMVSMFHLLPGQFAKESEVGDEAYKLLIRLAVPIFAGVSATLLTIFLRQIDHHTSDIPPTEDGPPIQTHRTLVPVWVGLSAVLAIGLAVDPGFVGLRDMRGSSSADLVVSVQAQRWSWTFRYEGGQTSTKELVLPVDKRVRFDITSVDIIHSFFVPAFRTKLDAVPGRTTKLYITPNRIADGSVDSTLRVQCAELCGLGHAKMATPLRIVSQADFDAWLTTAGKGS